MCKMHCYLWPIIYIVSFIITTSLFLSCNISFTKHDWLLCITTFFRELSRFIAAGKLHAKIDRVAAVLETNRPDAKNALYQETIKQGDSLLNRIQKLSRVIDL